MRTRFDPHRLPAKWSRHAKAGIIQAIALCNVAVSQVRGRAVSRRRLLAELEQARTEIAQLTEELAIKDERWVKAPKRRRPHYTPNLRMRILLLRAARAWTLDQTGRKFLVDEQTLSGW